MSDIGAGRRRPWRIRSWLVLASPILVAVILLLLLRDHGRPLKPARTPLPSASVLNDQPLMLTFNELIADPGAALNQRVRLTGEYVPLDVANCSVPRGPQVRWHLVADDLVLNAVGFESVLRLVPAGTLLTVDGIWRQYVGPLGCGKNAPLGDLWYLEVEQIVQPNPLQGAETGDSDSVPGQTVFPGTGTEGTPVTPEPTLAATPQIIETPATVVNTPVTPVQATTTVGATTSPGTMTPLAGTATATLAGPTRTPGPTPTDGTTVPPGGTASPSPSPTPTATLQPGSATDTPIPTPPSLITATPGGGYPGPPSSSTATATSTPEPYP